MIPEITEWISKNISSSFPIYYVSTPSVHPWLLVSSSLQIDLCPDSSVGNTASSLETCRWMGIFDWPRCPPPKQRFRFKLSSILAGLKGRFVQVGVFGIWWGGSRLPRPNIPSRPPESALLGFWLELWAKERGRRRIPNLPLGETCFRPIPIKLTTGAFRHPEIRPWRSGLVLIL